MGEFIQKSISTNLSELDDSKGYVEGYANTYNIKDSHGDISSPDSFLKTVKERSKIIKVYLNHDDNLMVGVPSMLNANDPIGLKTGTQFNMKTNLGRDAFYDVKFLVDNGFEAGMSIGAWVIKRNGKNTSIVEEYRLKEYSFLTKEQSNRTSLVTALKSADSPSELMGLLTKMFNLPYSDERLKQIELILKSLDEEPSGESVANSIDETTLTDKPTVNKSFFQILTSK
ncbi:HK97 family phage prohead protease [Sphingobacterium spiritivorum]|uniref:HK97 family phage prohead protease n=1 Tax=Sphingobacterium spiritivorum TaxID=258 RepID=UPI003DA4246D